MARRRLVWLFFGALAASGCADAGSGPDAAAPRRDGGLSSADAAGLDGAAPDDAGGSGGNDAGGSGGDDAGELGGDDAGGAGSAMVCQLGCSTGADCTTGSAAFDADNYRCEAGVCRYTGCNDDAECRATFSSDRYVCRDPGTGVRSCVQACAIPADCGSGTPAFDADNYRCDGGICVYEGCRDDVECEATFGGAYGCFTQEPPETPLPVPTADRNCVRRCTTPSDCGTDGGAFGADNYTCEGGACRYAGCNDDTECRASLSSDAYVCR